jgi:dolichyl-phosphate-mannose-protein mannosyltransferase
MGLTASSEQTATERDSAVEFAVERDVPARPAMGKAAFRWLALLICLAALGLRVYGVSFGLPNIGYYWDEPAVINRAVQFGGGDFNPHWHYYPAFFLYLTFLIIGAYGALGMAVGQFRGIEDFATRYFVDPTSFYLVARLFTAVLGALTVGVTILVGSRWFDRRVGLIAGALLTVSVLHSTHSSIAVTDTLHSLLIIAACLPLLGILRRGRWRDYVLTGLLIGLGAATKYLAVLMAPSIIVAHLLSARGSEPGSGGPLKLGARLLDLRLLAGLAAVPIGLFLGSPFTVLDYGGVLADFRSLSGERPMFESNDGRQVLLTALVGDVGWPLLIAAVVGLVAIVRRDWRRGAAFLTFPAIYFAFNMVLPRGLARYLIPLDPFIALAGAYALVAGIELIARRAALRRRRVVVGGLLAVSLIALVALPLYASLRWKMMVTHDPDSRTAALAWIHANLTPGTPIAIQSLYGKTYNNAPVLTDRKLVEIGDDIPNRGRFARIREAALTELARRPTYREIPFTYDFPLLRSSGACYIVLSSQGWGPEQDGHARFRGDLEQHARLISVFEPAVDLATATPYASLAVYPYLPPVISIFEVDGCAGRPARG